MLMCDVVTSTRDRLSNSSDDTSRNIVKGKMSISHFCSTEGAFEGWIVGNADDEAVGKIEGMWLGFSDGGDDGILVG